MPEKKDKDLELNKNIFENDCEKVKFTADEYLHGELPEEDKIFIDAHITECKDCFDFIEEEKKYLEEIKLAEYAPEISVSPFVIEKITENKITIDKPPRRRFIPFGLITAAAVVIILFAVSRGGPLNIFMKSSPDKNAESVNDAVGYGGGNENMAFGTMMSGDTNKESAGNIIAEANEDAIDETAEAEEAELGENMALMAEDGQEDLDGIANAAPPANTSAEEKEAATGEYRTPGNITNEEFFAANSDLEIEMIYRINYNDGLNLTIFKDIELFRTDYYINNYRIIESKYKETLDKNLAENNIISDVELLPAAYNGNIKYIGIIYYSKTASLPK